MRKFGGFMVGRRLVGAWRCALRRPRRQLRFLESGSVTARLLRWARSLARRLRRGGDYHLIGGQTSPLLEEEEGEAPPKAPPKGQLAVYLNGEWGPPQRYLVPVIYFNHPLFGELLEEAEAEFGFEQPGGITIPCPASRFERVRSRIAAARPAARKLGRMCWC